MMSSYDFIWDLFRFYYFPMMNFCCFLTPPISIVMKGNTHSLNGVKGWIVYTVWKRRTAYSYLLFLLDGHTKFWRQLADKSLSKIWLIPVCGLGEIEFTWAGRYCSDPSFRITNLNFHLNIIVSNPNQHVQETKVRRRETFVFVKDSLCMSKEIFVFYFIY